MVEKTKRENMEKKGNKKGKEPVEKEEICEIFDIEKDGKEKMVKKCAVEEEKDNPSKEQIKKEAKVFKVVAIVIVGLILMFLGFLWLINSMNKFDVGGTIFEIDKTDMVGKTLYKTSLPVQGTSEITGKMVTADYNFYLRNDPRQLDDKVPFYGILKLKKENVINLTENFNCDGDGVIAIANMLKLYEIVGGNVIKDGNASCDSLGRYGFINILKGNETYIDRSGPACYNIYVKDCEILKATERFMLEMFIETNQKIRQ